MKGGWIEGRSLFWTTFVTCDWRCFVFCEWGEKGGKEEGGRSE